MVERQDENKQSDIATQHDRDHARQRLNAAQDAAAYTIYLLRKHIIDLRAKLRTIHSPAATDSGKGFFVRQNKDKVAQIQQLDGEILVLQIAEQQLRDEVLHCPGEPVRDKELGKTMELADVNAYNERLLRYANEVSSNYNAIFVDLRDNKLAVELDYDLRAKLTNKECASPQTRYEQAIKNAGNKLSDQSGVEPVVNKISEKYRQKAEDMEMQKRSPRK